MGETYLDDIWSPMLHDEQTRRARSGDFGMLRPWAAAPHATSPVNVGQPDLAGVQFPPFSSESDHPSWLTEPEYSRFGVSLPLPEMPLDNAKFLQATLWRVPPASAPVILREDLAPGVALTQLVSQLSARAKTAGMEAITVSTATCAPRGTYPLSDDTYFYHGVPEMLLLSHLIQQALVAGGASCDLYLGCQRLSLFKPRSRRVRALLDTVNHLYAFGLNDAQDQAVAAHPRLLRFAITPQQKTLLEWFWLVVVDHPRGPTALVAQQVGGSLWADSSDERRYSGFWTFDPALVQTIVGILQDAGRALYFAQR